MSAATSILESWTQLSSLDFEEQCLRLFRKQAAENKVYAEFLRLLNINPLEIDLVSSIPFLPIQFFKSHEVKTGDWSPEEVFESSSTTGQVPSKHPIRDLDWYNQLSKKNYEYFYPPLRDTRILALLPSYLERKNASLVYMVENFIRESQIHGNGFFLYNFEDLQKALEQSVRNEEQVLLIGVSFALLDFAAAHPQDLVNSRVNIMETGGMKGRRKEMTRATLHGELKKAFGVQEIHSEYGMTELLSQSYSKSQGLFQTPPWQKVVVTDINDPFELVSDGVTGRINMIDLGNKDSIAFIATDDLGRIRGKEFEVLGRIDNSEIRGCNLLSFSE